MQSIIRNFMAVGAVVATAAFSVSGLNAQVAVADARPFMGDWNVTIESDTPITFRLNILEESGQVVAAVTGPDGAATTVRTVAKSGNDLVLSYTASVEGQDIPISISLTPEGDALRGDLKVADGLFAAPARAIRRE